MRLVASCWCLSLHPIKISLSSGLDPRNICCVRLEADRCELEVTSLVLSDFSPRKFGKTMLSVRYWEPMTGHSSEEAENSCAPSVDSVVYYLPKQIVLSLFFTLKYPEGPRPVIHRVQTARKRLKLCHFTDFKGLHFAASKLRFFFV